MALPVALRIASTVGNVGVAGGNVAKTVRDLVPQLEDEVTVEVSGQPGANKQQLYFLALAAANGMVRRFGPLAITVAPPFGMLMIEYNAAEEWVRCTIRYKWSCLNANAAPINVPRPGSWFDNLAVYRGPQCNVVGGNFDFVDPALPGIPASSVSPDAPNGKDGLPFAGSMILTSCPTTVEPTPVKITQDPAPDSPLKGGNSILSPNPKPPGDNRSRGAVVISSYEQSVGNAGGTIAPGSSVPSTSSDRKTCCEKIRALIPLVFSALSAPATNAQMTFGNPVPGPGGK